MKGLYLNTPPKPKQAKAMELQEAEQHELEDDRSLEEENKVKVVNRSSQQEAATKWKPWRELVAVLDGAHGDRSWTSRGGQRAVGRGHSSAQEVIVAIEA